MRTIRLPSEFYQSESAEIQEEQILSKMKKRTMFREVLYGGKMKTILDHANHDVERAQLICKRLYVGWDVDRAISTPKMSRQDRRGSIGKSWSAVEDAVIDRYYPDFGVRGVMARVDGVTKKQVQRRAAYLGIRYIRSGGCKLEEVITIAPSVLCELSRSFLRAPASTVGISSAAAATRPCCIQRG